MSNQNHPLDYSAAIMYGCVCPCLRLLVFNLETQKSICHHWQLFDLVVVNNNNWHLVCLTWHGPECLQILLNIYILTTEILMHIHNNVHTHTYTHTHIHTHTHAHISQWDWRNVFWKEKDCQGRFESKYVSNLVFYKQSIITVISGQKIWKNWERWHDGHKSGVGSR